MACGLKRSPQTLTLSVERLYHGRQFFLLTLFGTAGILSIVGLRAVPHGTRGFGIKKERRPMRLLENIKIQCIILLAVTGLFPSANWPLNGHN
jgi:hypothetical protein